MWKLITKRSTQLFKDIEQTAEMLPFLLLFLVCVHSPAFTHVDNFTSPIPPTTHVGCFQDGKWYPPESNINNGSDGKGWCYGTYCTAYGKVLEWDNWNCYPSLSPVTNPAPAITTLASSLVLGCFSVLIAITVFPSSVWVVCGAFVMTISVYQTSLKSGKIENVHYKLLNCY